MAPSYGGVIVGSDRDTVYMGKLDLEKRVLKIGHPGVNSCIKSVKFKVRFGTVLHINWKVNFNMGKIDLANHGLKNRATRCKFVYKISKI